MLVTLQIAVNSEGDGDPYRMSVLCSWPCSVLLSVAVYIPACDQGMPWAPEKSHTASLAVTFLMQGSGVAWMESTLVK